MSIETRVPDFVNSVWDYIIENSIPKPNTDTTRNSNDRYLSSVPSTEQVKEWIRQKGFVTEGIPILYASIPPASDWSGIISTLSNHLAREGSPSPTSRDQAFERLLKGKKESIIDYFRQQIKTIETVWKRIPIQIYSSDMGFIPFEGEVALGDIPFNFDPKVEVNDAFSITNAISGAYGNMLCVLFKQDIFQANNKKIRGVIDLSAYSGKLSSGGADVKMLLSTSIQGGGATQMIGDPICISARQRHEYDCPSDSGAGNTPASRGRPFWPGLVTSWGFGSSGGQAGGVKNVSFDIDVSFVSEGVLLEGKVNEGGLRRLIPYDTFPRSTPVFLGFRIFCTTGNTSQYSAGATARLSLQEVPSLEKEIIEEPSDPLPPQIPPEPIVPEEPVEPEIPEQPPEADDKKKKTLLGLGIAGITATVGIVVLHLFKKKK